MAADRSGDAYYAGLLDDVRLYDRALTQTEIILGHDVTASSTTPGLSAYWKFDEGIGRKAFDVSGNETDASIEGATFADDTPNILTAGVTDEGGYYTIEGVNYSEEETFMARPRKNFYQHNSIEFNAARGAFAALPAFRMPADSASIDIALQPFDLQAEQAILSGGKRLRALPQRWQLRAARRGPKKQMLGAATSKFQYLSLGLDAETNTVTLYRDGNLLSTTTFNDLRPPDGFHKLAGWRLTMRLLPKNCSLA